MSEMQKENLFFFPFPNASTFCKAGGTNKRMKSKRKQEERLDAEQKQFFFSKKEGNTRRITEFHCTFVHSTYKHSDR